MIKPSMAAHLLVFAFGATVLKKLS